ncbi:hypothetical protein [Vibrio barjaei]|uniref:hypothetical protein n=1 Tax=Vibrio barjaei TaxID=1676683 RepID=UPI0022836454|nr:hypothetical protein [Vibrio barjaei]MCY9874588.1 hypothetical protein [Vibrio barjaei]
MFTEELFELIKANQDAPKLLNLLLRAIDSDTKQSSTCPKHVAEHFDFDNTSTNKLSISEIDQHKARLFDALTSLIEKDSSKLFAMTPQDLMMNGVVELNAIKSQRAKSDNHSAIERTMTFIFDPEGVEENAKVLDKVGPITAYHAILASSDTTFTVNGEEYTLSSYYDMPKTDVLAAMQDLTN